MKLITRYMSKYRAAIILAIFIKLIGTMSELTLPYILEYMIDYVVPTKDLTKVILWGLLMFAAAVACRQLNVIANRRAIYNAHMVSYDVRQDLFRKTANLSGDSFDAFTLPSLISRMTSDSYNVQTAVQQIQSLCVRAPMILLGGVIMTLIMDRHLAMVLIVILPFLIMVVLFVSSRGIPMYTGVQKRLDAVVRIMRENITGIRVVKALSKEEYEKARFSDANAAMTRADIRAASVMAIPAPFMQMCLNTGLTIVVIYGAHRVNEGLMQPGVILAFLTYFNMITMGVMGLNRIFMSLSKASASADRIDEVLRTADDWQTIASTDNGNTKAHIEFRDVSFSYGKTTSPVPKYSPVSSSEPVSKTSAAEAESSTGSDVKTDAETSDSSYNTGIAADSESSSKSNLKTGTETSNTLHKTETTADLDPTAGKRSTAPYSDFAGGEREKALDHISFTLERGQSLGIIGPTGCGKTTIINLLMRFYDPDEGDIFIDGKNIKSFEKDELRRYFGVVFQNDMVFKDSIRNNIDFGRGLSDEAVRAAAEDAMAMEYIESLRDGMEYEAAIKGANLSGGQKQRLLVARALAGDPDILILDDSSSALDYKTDSAMRRAIRENHAGSTLILIAQRVSSVMNLDRIMVMDNGRCIGLGTHEELMKECAAYRETYEMQTT